MTTELTQSGLDATPLCDSMIILPCRSVRLLDQFGVLGGDRIDVLALFLSVREVGFQLRQFPTSTTKFVEAVCLCFQVHELLAEIRKAGAGRE